MRNRTVKLVKVSVTISFYRIMRLIFVYHTLCLNVNTRVKKKKRKLMRFIRLRSCSKPEFPFRNSQLKYRSLYSSYYLYIYVRTCCYSYQLHWNCSWNSFHFLFEMLNTKRWIDIVLSLTAVFSRLWWIYRKTCCREGDLFF